MKKLLSALMVLCLALCLLPAAALAADAGTKNVFADGKAPELVPCTSSDRLCTPLGRTLRAGQWGGAMIYIAGEEVTPANCGDVLGDGTVSFEYDAENEKGILTLNGASIVSEGDPPIDALDMENLEIVLKGKNTLKSTWEACVQTGNLFFSGTGSIDISTEEQYNWPVICENAFTVNSGDVKISSVNYAICLDGALTVNSGSLELIATDPEDAKAIDIGFEQLNVVLGDGMVMHTGANQDGSDAKETAATETDTIKAAKYIKIAGKPAPPAGNYYYYRTDTPQPSPKTADAGLLGLWCTLLLGSGAALPAVTLRRRKSADR